MSLCGSRFFPQSSWYSKRLHALVRRLGEPHSWARCIRSGHLRLHPRPRPHLPFGSGRSRWEPKAFESLTHDVAPSAAHWKSLPSIHMRWRITASLRDTATTALRRPLVFIRFMPQAFTADQPVVLVSDFRVVRRRESILVRQGRKPRLLQMGTHNEGTLDFDGFDLGYTTEGDGIPTLIIGPQVVSRRQFSKNLRTHLRMTFLDYRGCVPLPSRPSEASFQTRDHPR